MRPSELFAACVLMLIASAASAQSFTCGIGDRPACLDYGDTVCSSVGKCVDQDAACFDRYQCNYEGFTCRSNVTECANDYDDLLRTHNTLVDDYNTLLADREALRDELNDARRCLIYAATVAEARLCVR